MGPPEWQLGFELQRACFERRAEDAMASYDADEPWVDPGRCGLMRWHRTGIHVAPLVTDPGGAGAGTSLSVWFTGAGTIHWHLFGATALSSARLGNPGAGRSAVSPPAPCPFSETAGTTTPTVQASSSKRNPTTPRDSYSSGEVFGTGTRSVLPRARWAGRDSGARFQFLLRRRVRSASTKPESRTAHALSKATISHDAGWPWCRRRTRGGNPHDAAAGPPLWRPPSATPATFRGGGVLAASGLCQAVRARCWRPGAPRRGLGAVRVGQTNIRSVQSNPMQDFGRDHEIEHLRRSLAMLPAGADALKREEAMALLGRLRDVTARLRRVEDGLRDLLGEDPATAPGGPRSAG